MSWQQVSASLILSYSRPDSICLLVDLIYFAGALRLFQIRQNISRTAASSRTRRADSRTQAGTRTPAPLNFSATYIFCPSTFPLS